MKKSKRTQAETRAFDILPAPKQRRLWGQTANAGTPCLTSPNPLVDAPTCVICKP